MDWWVDGHVVAAESEEEARAEVFRLYNHVAEKAERLSDVLR